MDKWKADVRAEALQATAEFVENISYIIGTSISNWGFFWLDFGFQNFGTKL